MATPAQIGKEFERRVVDAAKKLGLKAHRVPLSGSVQTRKEYTQDVVLIIPDTETEKRGQCKKTQKYQSIRIDRDTVKLLENEKADFIAFALNQTPIIVMIPFEKYVQYIILEAIFSGGAEEHETD